MTRDAVQKAKGALEGEGHKASYNAVLARLGYGSKRDVSRLMRELVAGEDEEDERTTAVETCADADIIPGASQATVHPHAEQARWRELCEARAQAYAALEAALEPVAAVLEQLLDVHDEMYRVIRLRPGPVTFPDRQRFQRDLVSHVLALAGLLRRDGGMMTGIRGLWAFARKDGAR